MDFWDLTKLLIRRWYFALPMLTVTAVAVLATSQSVPPKWIATTYVQLLPPQNDVAAAAGAAPYEQRNPWLGVGLYNMANAAMLTVQDEQVLQELAKAGLSDTFTASIGSGLPTVTFTITADSQDQAIKTAGYLFTRYDQNITRLQDGVAAGDRVTTKRLDLGANLKESNGNVKRALIAVAGVGLLLSVGLTVGVDALVVRRSRRRLDDELQPAPTQNPRRTAARPEQTPRNADPRLPALPAVRPNLSDLRPNGATGSEAAPGRGAPTIVLAHDAMRSNDSDSTELTVPGAPPPPPRDTTTTTSESTLVLPLSFGWGRSGNSHGNDS